MPLRGVRPEVRALLAEPTLHLLQAEIGRCMHGEEHTARGPARRRGVPRESLAFANHTVFEVPNLEDAIPSSIAILAELDDLGAEKMAVDECRSRGEEHLGEVSGRDRDARRLLRTLSSLGVSVHCKYRHPLLAYCPSGLSSCPRTGLC